MEARPLVVIIARKAIIFTGILMPNILDDNLKGYRKMDYAKESLNKHAQWGGKIEVISTVPCRTRKICL